MNLRDLRGDRLAVYGDTLAADGHAQGTLIHLQVARHRTPFARRAHSLKEHETQLLAQRRDELLGPLAELPKVEVSWALGFLSELRLGVTGDDQLEALAEALGTTPFARLERLVLTGPVTDLSCLEGTALRSLALDGIEDWAAVLDTLPPVRALSCLGAEELDFDGVSLPATELLRVDVGFQHLDQLEAPKLRALRLSEWAEETTLPPLELLHLDGYLTDEPGEQLARRVIHEWQHGDDDGEVPGVISRSGRGRFGERAFLLSTAPAELCRALVTALTGRNLVASIAPLQFAFEPFTAVALRAEHATDGALLRALSHDLARQGHRTLEFAVSPSNFECIAWAIETDSRVRPLVMGPANEHLALWRQALDRALAIDPGDALPELLLELDASEPVVVGEPPPEGTEWPLVTTFTPRQPDWGWDYDEPEEDEADETFDALDFRDQSGARNWWKTPGADEAPPGEVEGGPVAAADAPEIAESVDESADDEHEQTAEPASEWGEIVSESPVELESDGEERNPEFGLEADAFDPDSVPATVLTDGVDPVECEVCEARDLELRPCFSCGRRVCAACTIGEPRADGEVKCNACPDPVPHRAPPAEAAVETDAPDEDEDDDA